MSKALVIIDVQNDYFPGGRYELYQPESMMTHMCVDTTVRAAKDLGYRVTLIEDACAARELE